MRRAVHFGAGKIGRGFLGQLYFESGCHTTFIDVMDGVVQALKERKAYPIRIVEEDSHTVEVHNVDAVHAADAEAAASAIAQADILSTAVGVHVLDKIAPVLARGLAQRFGQPGTPPCNVIVCENLIHAGDHLRQAVRKHLSPEHQERLEKEVGFVDASIGRMVPVMTAEQQAEDPLLVCVEPYCELPVDAQAFVGEMPDIRHMKPMDNFLGYVERKLFLHNMTHAATAYLGYLRNHEFIWQAIRDERVKAAVEAAGREACAALAAKHGLDPSSLEAHRADLVRRYHNRALGDQVARVGQDPIRKLGHEDRLVGAAECCLATNVQPVHITTAIAAALHYDASADPAAVKIQALRTAQGPAAVWREICGLTEQAPLWPWLRAGEEKLAAEGWV